ncbi:MAG: FGGY-family carbohydrate kinase [Gammaproteobacteria bacterium]|nr:FGGY-family carbohydrate kinase [Gammaproteobacteria bacterium]MDH5592032.1 FGGY-family carbohydrate kinase [Gammaproteobacteria bacterium]
MNNNAWIGIDLGTSGCRAIAIDATAKIIAQSQQPLANTFSTPPCSEQNPDTHWQLVKQVLQQLTAQCQGFEIKAIAVDATSGSILITDHQGKPLTPIIMYNDSRAVEQSKTIADLAPAHSGAHGASSGLAKLLHAQQHAELPSGFKLLHQADWLNFKLGASLGITDENNALKTGYDPVNRSWPDWLDSVTDRTVLPDVVLPGTMIGQLSTQLCGDLNLNTVPDIIAGTTDSIAALIATGAHEIGDAVTSLGSTLVVKLISDKPVFLPEQGVYSHRLGDKWLVGGASNSGGAVLRHFFNDKQIQQFSEHISVKAATADFYPLLSPGERFPVNDPNFQPRLTPRPSSNVEFLHGLLNGIAKIEKQAYHCLQQAGASSLNSIRTVGGGAGNQIWQTIRQQHIKVPFIKPEHTEAAYGVARIAQGITLT